MQAEWVLNHLSLWGYRKAEDVVQVVERVLTHHLGFPALPPAEWVDEAAHIAGIVEEIRTELTEENPR